MSVVGLRPSAMGSYGMTTSSGSSYGGVLMPGAFTGAERFDGHGLRVGSVIRLTYQSRGLRAKRCSSGRSRNTSGGQPLPAAGVHEGSLKETEFLSARWRKSMATV